MVRAPDEFASTAPRKQTSPLKWMLIGCGLFALLVFGGIAILAVFVGLRIREFGQFAEEVTKNYNELNAQFPFEPPAEPEPAPSDRTIAYLRVRQSVMQTIPDNLESRVENAESLERTMDMSPRDLYRLVQDMHQFLKSASEAHVEALRTEQMSPDEFAWIHGQVIKTILDKPEGDPKRAIYDAVIRDLEEAEKHSDNANYNIDFEDYREGLEKNYGETQVSEDIVQRFEQSSRVGAMIDLLAASPDIVEELEKVEAEMRKGSSR